MKLRIFFSVMLFVLFALNTPHANAWGCSNPLASRVDVGTTKPSGVSAGDGDGQYYIGPDAANKGDYYVCQVPKTATPKNGTKQKQGQKQSQSQSSNSSSTATGGSSVLKNAGNSTLTNSGNSSNTNSLTATGGQGGSATSSSTASAQNNGNGSNNASYNSQTTIDAAHIPVNTAYAPTTIPTMSCFKTYSAGAQTSPFGISLGGGKVDENCRKLETAVHAPNQLVFCKVYITTRDAKSAGVTLQDCLGTPVVAAPAPSTIEDKKITNTPESMPALPLPTYHPESVDHTQDGGDCVLYHGRVGNVCQRVIESVKLKLEANQEASLTIHAQTIAEAATTAAYLINNGVPSSRIGDPVITGRKPEQPVGSVSFIIRWTSIVSVVD